MGKRGRGRQGREKAEQMCTSIMISDIDQLLDSGNIKILVWVERNKQRRQEHSDSRPFSGVTKVVKLNIDSLSKLSIDNELRIYSISLSISLQDVFITQTKTQRNDKISCFLV